MPAELVVVNGPLAGTRYKLDKPDILLGRAPNSNIVMSEAEIGWRHCQIRQSGERFLITDLRSSLGTYINGVRSAERWLDDRDQVGIGRTILMFRSGVATAQPETIRSPLSDEKPVLLAACSLVFLSRALAANLADSQNTLLQTQILRVVSDLIPSRESVLLLGATAAELQFRLEERSSYSNTGFEHSVHRICDEGAHIDSATGTLAVPLYLAGTLSGAILAQVDSSDESYLAAGLDALTAIASLVSIGFEANREVETLRAENALLQQQIPGSTGIVGQSPPIKRLLALIERVAPRDTTVLITGESGTGKELIARALHEKSQRSAHAFVAVNCAALSETLFESELFGHEKGAFTGAISLKRGRFELAQGGTIFLDEVGELALPLQAKILRVLQQREFERVGGTQSHQLDIRIIAATNRDLTEDIRDGKFREDLYHRLNVVTLQSPPLRERKDDIPLLANYFLQSSAERCKRHIAGLAEQAQELMMDYSWPGNVRELQNAMERAVVLGLEETILPEDLPETLLESAPRDANARYHFSVGQAKRDAILDAYSQGGGDYKQAAKLLGLHPNYLLRLVRNLNLRDEINNRSQAVGR